MAVNMQNTQEKADLTGDDMKTKNVCVDGNKVILRKNGDHIPGSLGGRLIVMVRQANSEKILKFNNFNCKAHLICLNGFIVLIAFIIVFLTSI